MVPKIKLHQTRNYPPNPHKKEINQKRQKKKWVMAKIIYVQKELKFFKIELCKIVAMQWMV